MIIGTKESVAWLDLLNVGVDKLKESNLVNKKKPLFDYGHGH